ncbi:MAG: tetratricopeptide repeat protein, partial [Planctomycetota bacterium]|nr:tetratricopeptide repeat protein [Planctomycetota bacterium]
SGDAPAARFRLAWIRYFDEQYDGALALLDAIDPKKADKRILADAAYLRGNCLLERHKFKEAADAFKAYLDTADAKRYRADALLKRGLAAKRAGDNGAAADALERLLAKHADSPLAPEADYNLADLLAEKNADQAAVHYRRVAEKHPDHRLAPYALSGLADLEAKRGKRDEAVAAYGRLAEKYPKSDLAPRALYRKATLLAKAKQPAEARAAYEQVAKQYPDHALASDALLGLGLALEAQKAFEEAAGVFRRLLAGAKDPKTREQATYELAWSLQQAGKQAEAAQAYRQLADGFPDSPLAADAHFHLAEAPYRQKDYAKAVPLYEKALAAGDERLQDKVLYRLGWCRWAQKKYPEAAALFDRLVKECPKSGLVPEALLQAGEAYAKAGKPSEAIQRLQALTNAKYKTFEHAAEARFRLGECQAILGRHDQALGTFTELEKAFPEYKRMAKVQFQLGKALYDLKRHDQARKRFRQALAATDTETAAKSQFYIGETYLAENNPREALKAYLRVVALWAGYTEWAAAAQFEIGKCYTALGKTQDARAAYQTVAEKYKDTKWAEPARAQLNR